MIAPRDDFPSEFERRVSLAFGPGGLLSKSSQFEYRPQQQTMASAVAKACRDRTHLIVEAGTGVGKSLAYLVPSIFHALAENRKALVSTHTINLQEQLFHKDIPLVQKLLPEQFKAVLLKGRQNYLCPLRLQRAMSHGGDLFGSREQDEMKRIWEWSHKTRDGTLSDLDPAPDPAVWLQVCSEPHVCTQRTCGMGSECFYQRARKEADAAKILVLNHSLFFNFLAGAEGELAERGYLFHNDFVIFDEAHTLESVAARHLGLDISHGGLRYLLHRIFNPRTQKGIVAALRSGEATKLAMEAEDEADLFFDRLERSLDFKRGKELRLREPGVAANSLDLPLARLYRSLADEARDIEDEVFKAEVQEAARQVEGMRAGLGEFLGQARKDHVYWIERHEKRDARLTLTAAPIDVAPQLRKLLFRPDNTAIMTSATLAVGDGLRYFVNRVGGEDATALQVDSPFDYARQMRVFIPKKMPEPAAREAYEEALAHWIRHFVSMTQGKAFVLFTSYQTMQKLAESLASFFKSEKITCLVQGGALPRHRLLQKFKDDRDSVLFGTDSFWQGVDVPGEALSNVILTRLPFAVPDHPLTQAKCERIIAEGGDAFRQFSLPEAILKFRQGVGRLIRTQQDKGIVVILDNRVLTKSYGKAFLAVLPKCPVEVVE
ncbi:MAG TPA: helicase C-terminal domain-containing protein [Candidatus Methylacidiphilales bacterium]|jgi:ATP-dependent DNA helicase DinG|nr:helicase C-terminal domain-containing protein [Candidatus Methylacidiphilales bacterium]